MNRLGKWLVVSAISLSATGIGIHGAWDYLIVGRQRIAKAVRDNIPLPVEIERLQVLIARLDDQLAKHQRVVAEAAVELERTERDVARERESVQQTRAKMVGLRDLATTDACSVSVAGRQYSRAEIETALRNKLENYKAGKRTCDVREAALARQRASFEKLSRKLADWKAERDTLNQTLVTLRTEFESLKVSDHPEVVFDDSELRTARELVGRIESRLDVEQKLRDLQAEPDELLEAATNPAAGNVVREVDDLLGSAT